MTPIYKSELVRADAPSGLENPMQSQPQAPSASNDAETNQRDNLAYSLSKVCNQNVNKLDRIHNIPTALNYFSNSQARVQVVGCDNRTIVNTCSVESYLNYLSIATQMDQVVVLDAQKNASGKVSYIKVHEIHYQ